MPLDEGVFTLEEQAKRLGLDGPQEVYVHTEAVFGRGCFVSWKVMQEALASYSPCKCDHCIGTAPINTISADTTPYERNKQ